MRVIAGTARGVPLTAPEGFNTRPTAGRLRENLFNILSPAVKGSRFLDLFGGSGAVGIEALSRGAARAVFAEVDRQAADIIKANLVKTKLIDKAEVLLMSAERAVRRLSAGNNKFDIIFLDPPYESDYLRETVDLLADAVLLTPVGMLIAELPAGDEPPESMFFTVKRIKVYGDKKFVFWG